MNAFIRSTKNEATARFSELINGTPKEPPKKQEPETDPQHEYLQNRVNALNKLVEAEQKLEALRKGE